MRRVGLVLTGLGTCLIVFAVLAASWITGQVIKFPLNEFASVTLTAPNATYFSVAKLTEMTGVNIEATYTIKGNAAAGSSSTAVWNQFVYVYDQTNKAPIQSMTRTFAFDRRSAQLTNCCGSNVGGDSSIKQDGYVGYVLPIGTKKQTYDIFDTNLNKAVPFTYTGIGDVDGTQAYKFTENVAPTQNGTQTVPGSLVNQAAASVTLPQYYQAQTTYWIDPLTGALLNVTQNEKLTLRNTDGTQALVLLNANLAATQPSIDGLVALDNNQVSKASLVGTLLPLVTGIIGLLLLIIGIVLFRKPEADAEAAPSRREPELAAAEPEVAARPSLVPGLEDESRQASVESPVVREAAVNEAAQEEAVGAKAAETKAAEAKTAESEAAASDAKAADAEAKAEEKSAEADAEPASPAAAAEEAKAEAPAAEAPAAETPAAEAHAAEDAPADVAPAEAPTAEIPATEAATAESPAADDATAETSASTAAASRRRRGTHRR
jgi:Porin PorA